MPKRARNETTRERHLQQTAPRLIGAGLLMLALPVLLSKSPVAAAFKTMVPFGWLLFVTGCVLLWWKVHRTRSAASSFPPLGRAAQAISPRPSSPRAPLVRQHPPAPQSWGPEVFQAIEWRRFEAVVEALFAQAGFRTQSQTHGADEGIDIWLYSDSKPGAPASLVQCKHWQGKRIGVDKVRELRGVMAAKGVSRGQFATTSTFTDDAIAFAKESGIHLLDVKTLLALIATRTEAQRQDLLAVALEGDYWRPTCVNCGIKMLERKPRKGGALFWGCSGYPRCKTSMPMRQT